jgi:hypothetical protein
MAYLNAQKYPREVLLHPNCTPIHPRICGGAAGVEQAQNHFIGYGQGVQGYGKRFGAGYADTLTARSSAAPHYPSLLKQGPRYWPRSGHLQKHLNL